MQVIIFITVFVIALFTPWFIALPLFLLYALWFRGFELFLIAIAIDAQFGAGSTFPFLYITSTSVILIGAALIKPQLRIYKEI